MLLVKRALQYLEDRDTLAILQRGIQRPRAGTWHRFLIGERTEPSQHRQVA